MVSPWKVTAPKDKLKLLDVLIEKPDWSLAAILWKDDSGNDGFGLGIRWNGEKDEIGMPSSRGVPTWYLIPDEFIELAAAGQIPPKDKAALVNALKKAKQKQDTA